MYELLRRSRIWTNDHVFFDEVDRYAEFVKYCPILDVSVQPIGLLDQDRIARRVMLLQIRDHLIEAGPTALLSGFDINVLLDYYHTRACGVIM